MGKADLDVLEKRIEEAEKRERAELRARQKEIFKKERVSFWTDFKKFVTKGNVLDLAVGVVIGTAFNAIVNGLVKMIINPCVAYFTDGVSLEELRHVIREASVDPVTGEEIAELAILYGSWIQTIIDFLIIALSVFVAVRVIKTADRKIRAKELAKREAEAKRKKAEEERKAAEAKAIADRLALEDKAARDRFYANVERQTALLERISQRLDAAEENGKNI